MHGYAKSSYLQKNVCCKMKEMCPQVVWPLSSDQFWSFHLSTMRRDDSTEMVLRGNILMHQVSFQSKMCALSGLDYYSKRRPSTMKKCLARGWGAGAGNKIKIKAHIPLPFPTKSQPIKSIAEWRTNVYKSMGVFCSQLTIPY